MKKFVRVLALTLVALTLCAAFAACAPAKDPADAKAALEKAGYTAAKTGGEGLAFVGIKDCTDVVTGTYIDKENDNKVETVAIYYFESADAANTAFEDMEDIIEEFKDEDDDDSDWVFKKSGKIIYGGTKAAVKAAR